MKEIRCQHHLQVASSCAGYLLSFFSAETDQIGGDKADRPGVGDGEGDTVADVESFLFRRI